MPQYGFRNLPRSVLSDIQLDGQDVATSGVTTVAAPTVTFGIPIVVRFTLVDQAVATTDLDFTVPAQFRILDVIVLKITATGGGANTIQIRNAGNVVSDAMNINVAAGVIVRPATLDPAFVDINLANPLRFRIVKAAGDTAVRVAILGVRT